MTDDAILDQETAIKILSHMNLNTSTNRTSALNIEEDSPQKKTFGSFKSMKRDKQKK